MLETPATRERRLVTSKSANRDSSRADRVLDSKASDTTALPLSILKRVMLGGRASLGKPDCSAAMRSRTSCIARSILMLRPNSTLVWLRPSNARVVIRLMPAIELSASSTGLDISRSTASGDAPG